MGEKNCSSIRRSEEFKKEVVRDYLKYKPQKIGTFCKNHGIERRSLYRWIVAYEEIVSAELNKSVQTLPDNNTFFVNNSSIVQLSYKEYIELLNIRSKYEAIKALI